MIYTKEELKKENLKIDLREINHILETKPNIMASEYAELSLAKRIIIEKLMGYNDTPLQRQVANLHN